MASSETPPPPSSLERFLRSIKKGSKKFRDVIDRSVYQSQSVLDITVVNGFLELSKHLYQMKLRLKTFCPAGIVPFWIMILGSLFFNVVTICLGLEVGFHISFPICRILAPIVLDLCLGLKTEKHFSIYSVPAQLPVLYYYGLMSSANSSGM
jgi:hypothetical protein